MKVHIITKDSWILRRIAEEVAKYTNATISERPNKRADINYFVNYALFEPVDSITVGYFTHIEPNTKKRWKEVENQFNAAVYIADKYKPQTPVRAKIYPTGLNYKVNPKLRIGISGRPYKSGRKGEDDIAWLVEQTKDSVDWVALGSPQWGKYGINEVEGWKSDEDSVRFYQDLDLFLCMSKIEGGPIPVVEAIKCGTPVISTLCGNHEEWQNATQLVRDRNEALELINGMITSHEVRKEMCRRDWEWFGRQHKAFFNKILSIL